VWFDLKKLKMIYIYIYIYILRWWHIGLTRASQLNLLNSRPRSWIPLGLTIFLKYFLLINMIKKIDICKIEHQSKYWIFIWGCDDLMENKPKQIMKTNSKSIKYWRMKLKIKTVKKDSIKKKKIERWNFF